MVSVSTPFLICYYVILPCQFAAVFLRRCWERWTCPHKAWWATFGGFTQGGSIFLIFTSKQSEMASSQDNSQARDFFLALDLVLNKVLERTKNSSLPFCLTLPLSPLSPLFSVAGTSCRATS